MCPPGKMPANGLSVRSAGPRRRCAGRDAACLRVLLDLLPEPAEPEIRAGRDRVRELFAEAGVRADVDGHWASIFDDLKSGVRRKYGQCTAGSYAPSNPCG